MYSYLRICLSARPPTRLSRPSAREHGRGKLAGKADGKRVERSERNADLRLPAYSPVCLPACLPATPLRSTLFPSLLRPRPVLSSRSHLSTQNVSLFIEHRKKPTRRTAKGRDPTLENESRSAPCNYEAAETRAGVRERATERDGVKDDNR